MSGVVIAVVVLVMHLKDVLCHKQPSTKLASALLYFQQRCFSFWFGRVFSESCPPVKPVSIEGRAGSLNFGVPMNLGVSIGFEFLFSVAKASTRFLTLPVALPSPAIPPCRVFASSPLDQLSV